MKRVPRGMLKSAQFRAFFDEMQKIAISNPLGLAGEVGGGMRAARLRAAAKQLEGKVPTTVRMGPSTWGRAADKLQQEKLLRAGRPAWLTS